MAENEKKVAETAQASVAETKTDAPAPKAEKKPKKDKVKFTDRVKKFWRDYKSEFKKIVWSPWNQVRKNTIVVIVVVIVLALIIGLLDFLFGHGITELKNLINPAA